MGSSLQQPQGGAAAPAAYGIETVLLVEGELSVCMLNERSTRSGD